MKYICLTIFAVLMVGVLSRNTRIGYLDVFDNNLYKFKWSIDYFNKTITFDLDVATRGWFGFALSTIPSYQGSDVIVAYINSDGFPVVSDRYALSNTTMPVLDTTLGGTDDIFDVTGYYANGRSHVRFCRKLITGDRFDLPIYPNEKIFVMFAWSKTPVSVNEALDLTFTERTLQLILYPFRMIR